MQYQRIAEPQFVPAAEQGGRHDHALADLALARRSGADPVRVDYDEALDHVARNDSRSAAECLRRVPGCDPGHAEALKRRRFLR